MGHGTDFNTRLSLSSKVLGSVANFAKLRVELHRQQHLFAGHSFSVGVKAGGILGHPPFYERFYMDGDNQLRGVERRVIGPEGGTLFFATEALYAVAIKPLGRVYAFAESGGVLRFVNANSRRDAGTAFGVGFVALQPRGHQLWDQHGHPDRQIASLYQGRHWSVRQRWRGSIFQCSSHVCSRPVSPHLHSTSRKTACMLYVQSDTLRVDATIAALFSKRAIDAIESGMTTSIAVQFRLRTGRGEQVGQRGLVSRLEHDIWEGEYRLIRQAAQADTLRTSDFEDIRSACSELQGIDLVALPLPKVPLTLQVRLDVNPISPEQASAHAAMAQNFGKGQLSRIFLLAGQNPICGLG